MNILKLSIVLVLLCLVGCNKISNIKQSEDIISKPIPGYSYNEITKRYINEENGIWYVVENGENIIPKDEFIEAEANLNSNDFIIQNRANDIWELSEIKEVIVEVGDNFYSLANNTYNTHYRMDKEWYYEQVKNLNKLEDIDIIPWKEPFKLPIYIDSKK